VQPLIPRARIELLGCGGGGGGSDSRGSGSIGCGPHHTRALRLRPPVGAGESRAAWRVAARAVHGVELEQPILQRGHPLHAV
jgi:hypothetical protein